MHTQVHIHTHKYTHARTHTCTHTHMHTHTPTRARIHLLNSLNTMKKTSHSSLLSFQRQAVNALTGDQTEARLLRCCSHTTVTTVHWPCSPATRGRAHQLQAVVLTSWGGVRHRTDSGCGCARRCPGPPWRCTSGCIRGCGRRCGDPQPGRSSGGTCSCGTPPPAR